MTKANQNSNDVGASPEVAEVSAQWVTAEFLPDVGFLTAFGDDDANTIEFSRDAAGEILVNDGATPILGGTPTVANTNLISAFGLGGDDVITLDETNGALPRANLFGGGDNDTITGGSGNDLLFGQAGNDTLLGRGGFDQLSAARTTTC
jgi:Ca2+-binding RTX toxin-like protein